MRHLLVLILVLIAAPSAADCYLSMIDLPQAGWHMVAAPLDEPISRDCVGIIADGTSLYWDMAFALGLCEGHMTGYEGTPFAGGYYFFGLPQSLPSAVSATRCGEGYWFYTHEPDLILLWRMPPRPPG